MYTRKANATRETPKAWSGMTNRTPVRERLGARGVGEVHCTDESRVMPVEGRDLSSRRTQYVERTRRLGNLSTPESVRNCRRRARESEGRSRLSFLRPVTTRSAVMTSWPMLMPSAAPTRAHRVWMDRTSRTSKRMGCSDGLANWRLRSGKRLTDRTPSEECSYRKPMANSGRWASRPCVIESA